MTPLLEVKDLCVEFPTRRGALQAVAGISFTLNEGERLGLVGESGSGKSMTLLTLLGLTPSQGRLRSGSVRYRGQELLALSARKWRQLRGRELAMIFQDPMTTMNPVFKVGEQVREALRVHHAVSGPALFPFDYKRRQLERERVIALLHEVGIPSPEERYDAYPHEFSGGMQQRAMIAIALACRPQLLLADEPTTALDVTVQAQIMALLDRLSRERKMAIILVTHDLSLAAEFCDRIAVMYAGKIVEEGTTAEVIGRPQHPYTQGLLTALPHIECGVKHPPEPIPGEVDLSALPPGCAFAPRCVKAMEVCWQQPPANYLIAPGHLARCWLYEEGR